MISIAIPVYNGKKYIMQTIESCLQQTRKDIEIIVVDDCSSDNSYEELKAVYQQDKRVYLFQNAQNMGFIKTCNFAAEQCRGEYLLVMGQDDLLQADYLEGAIAALEKQENAVAVYCNPIFINSQGETIGDYLSEQEIRRNGSNLKFVLARTCSIPSTGLVMKKSAFIAAGGYPTKYRNYGEWELWINLLQQGDMIFFDAARSMYRRHETNMSTVFDEKKEKKKKQELHKYWNHCRRKALREFKWSLRERLYLCLYLLYISLTQ